MEFSIPKSPQSPRSHGGEISHLLAERSVPPAHLNGERLDCDAPDSTELLILIGQMDEQLQTYTTRLKTHGLLDPEPG